MNEYLNVVELHQITNLADDLEGASKLLQHSSTKLTSDHYRSKPEKLRAVS